MNIKPIETEYNGYRFRSRLEARWAVFFDAAGLAYEPEPEGFELPDGTRYLPDGYLKDYDTYVEIKPKRPGAANDLQRAAMFVDGKRIKRLLILPDIPGPIGLDGIWNFPLLYYTTRFCGSDGSVESGWAYFYYTFYDDQNEKPIIGLRTRGNPARTYLRLNKWTNDDNILLEAKRGSELDIRPEDRPWDDVGISQPELERAYMAARQARFEHGEKPNTGR